MATRFFALCIVMCTMLGAAAPGGPPAQTLVPAKCEASADGSAAFARFLAANPALAKVDRPEQIAAFRSMGRAGWARILVHVLGAGQFAGLSVAGEDSGTPEEIEKEALDALDIDSDDLPHGLRLAPDNPLLLMRRFAEAYGMLAAGEHEAAIAASSSAIDDAARLWGADNAGLVLGYATRAQARWSTDDQRGAIADTLRGLQVIAAHPERATGLAYFKTLLLELERAAREADAANTQGNAAGPVADPKAMAAAPVGRELAALKAEATRTRQRHLLSIDSPLSDLAALIPGTQPIAEWGLQAGRSAFPVNALSGVPIGSLASLSAALIPSVPDQRAKPYPFKTSPEIVGEIDDCLSASQTMAEAGDFLSAAQINARMLSLVNERNAVLIAKDFDDDAEDYLALQTALETLTGRFEDAGESSAVLLHFQGGLVAYAQGSLADLARRLERSITPRAGARLIAALSKDDDAFPRDAIRANAADLGQALIYVRTAIALLLRPPESADVATMEEAVAWADTGGADRLRTFIGRLGDRDSSVRLNAKSRGAKLAADAAPALFSSFGWASAMATENTSAARAFERDIFDRYARLFRGSSKSAFLAQRASLLALRRAQGPAAERSIANVTPLIAATIEIVPQLKSAFSGQPVEPSKRTAEDTPQPTVALVAAYFLIPLAAEAEDWDLVLRLGEGPAKWLRGMKPSDALLELAEDDPDPAQRLAIGFVGRPLTSYLQALSQRGRHAEIASLADLAMPTVRSSAKDETERTTIAVAAPDQLLAYATNAYLQLGRLDDAHLLAKARIERLAINVGLPPVLGGTLPGLGIDRSRQIDRNPYAQLLAVAARRPPSADGWNDILTAVDAGKRTDAGDAVLLRQLAQSAGPEARETYDSLVHLDAQLDRARRGDLSSLRPDAASIVSLTEQLLSTRVRLLRLLGPQRSRLLTTAGDVAALQKSLAPDELAIAANVVSDQIVLLAIRHEGSPRLLASPVAYSQLLPAISALERRFALPSQGYDPVSYAWPDPDQLALLHRALIEPFDDLVRSARLILWSPDLRLAAVPIAAVAAPAEYAVTGERPTRYLGLAKAISFAPRLSALALQRSSQDDAIPPGSLAIGAVPFTRTGPDQAMSGPAVVTASTLLDRQAQTYAAPTLRRFAELTSGPVLEGTRASLAELAPFQKQPIDLLMFYTHGIGLGQPLGPALILSPTAGPDLPLLRAEDIQTFSRAPRHVLLAACSTGASGGNGLDPYGGLVQSFLAIGAVSVLSAQSTVDEAATAALVDTVLTHMTRDRLAPAEALRRAQRRLSEDPRFANPVFWAPLAWVGDGARR